MGLSDLVVYQNIFYGGYSESTTLILVPVRGEMIGVTISLISFFCTPMNKSSHYHVAIVAKDTRRTLTIQRSFRIVSHRIAINCIKIAKEEENVSTRSIE